ncbi:acyl-ACP desaturase [Streptomyces zhihengii]
MVSPPVRPLEPRPGLRRPARRSVLAGRAVGAQPRSEVSARPERPDRREPPRLPPPARRQRPRDNAWDEWLHRWTAEEDRHSTVMLSYIHTTRAVDPIALERARMRYMSTPPRPDDLPSDPLHGLAYVMIQELATRVAHRNTGLHCGESVCARLFARVAQDENLHMVFYRDLYAALLDLIPDQAMASLWRA